VGARPRRRDAHRGEAPRDGAAAAGGGLHKSNAVDPQLESAWFQFQPLNLSSDILVSTFAFKLNALHRYTKALDSLQKLTEYTVHLSELNTGEKES
jgi:hypothetical protein